ncbi:ABC transporter permease [Arthrobacter sp. GCM10027362]|uniref:ABC transporter permease n=1 Tax=Arthrobacter sp. GCM10027362 TaxID=3273379 RepID=UPI003644026E
MGTMTTDKNLRVEAAGQAKSQGRRRTAQQWSVRLPQFLIVIAFLVLWEIGAGRFVDDLLISRPSEIFPELWSWIVDGDLLYHAASTFKDSALGLLCGGLAGLAVGCILGQSKKLAVIFEPFITALYTMPKHALIPLFIMWVGINSELRVLTSSTIVFFLIFNNTSFGIRDVSTALVNSVRVMGGSSADVLFRVSLPSALIWVVAAMKLAVPQAIVGVVVAEMLAGDRGLGFLVAMNAGTFNTAGTFAAITALLVAGFLVDRLVGFLTRRALSWKTAS